MAGRGRDGSARCSASWVPGRGGAGGHRPALRRPGMRWRSQAGLDRAPGRWGAGHECQVDCGRMGLVFDPATERRRVCHGLAFTAVCPGTGTCGYRGPAPSTASTRPSWSTPRPGASPSTRPGCGGPRTRGRVERTGLGASLVLRRRGVRRSHRRPAPSHRVVHVRGRPAHPRHHPGPPGRGVRVEERHLLLPAPTTPYDLPTYPHPLVARDHHIEVDKALYSVPGNRIGQRVDVRADRQSGAHLPPETAHQGPCPHPCRQSADRFRRPPGREDALCRARRRGTQGDGRGPRPRHRRLRRRLVGHAPALDQDAPGLRPGGLVRRWGAERVDGGLRPGHRRRGRERGVAHQSHARAGHRTGQDAGGAATATPTGRFARDSAHFASGGAYRPHSDANPGLENPATGLSEDGSRAEGGAA